MTLVDEIELLRDFLPPRGMTSIAANPTKPAEAQRLHDALDSLAELLDINLELVGEINDARFWVTARETDRDFALAQVGELETILVAWLKAWDLASIADEEGLTWNENPGEMRRLWQEVDEAAECARAIVDGDIKKRRIRLELAGGAHMDVSLAPGASPETIEALRQLGEAAAKRMRDEGDPNE